MRITDRLLTDKVIANIQDFTFQLRNRKPGDTVTVIVLRDGKDVTADVTLVTRQQ